MSGGEDDLFGVPDNDIDEEMLDANDDEDIDSQPNNMDVDNENEGDEDEEEDDGEEEEDDENENEDDEDEEEDDDDDDDNDGEDDTKFMDAKESQDDNTLATTSNQKELTEETINQNGKGILPKDDTKKVQFDHNLKVGEGHTSNEEMEEETSAKPPQELPQQEEEVINLTPQQFRADITAKAKIATEFDIVPSVAIPYTSQCHSLAFTDGPKWILTGGEDGFIRKYDFFQSIEGKSPLTMAQRHSLVDSITKAGVISSYWENEQPMTKQQLMHANPKLKASDFSTGSVSYEPKISPVYALDVERNGYWCLSGLLSGGISLYTMRYNEGNIHHYFPHTEKTNKDPISLNSGHRDTVSVLKLSSSEKTFLSGSWDKTIREWDLNTGKCTNLFSGSTGQISNIQFRPQGLADLTVEIDESDNVPQNGEIINKEFKSKPNNKVNGDAAQQDSDVDSLFGDEDDEDEEKRKNQDDDVRKPSLKDSENVSSKKYTNESIFMSSSIDGTINIWDVRTSAPVLRLGVPDGTPPWCMSSTWSNDGEYIYAGRRNSTVEEFSIRMPHRKAKIGQQQGLMVPNVLKLLQFPKISGPVSALSTMPNDNFLLCGSNDNIRLYSLDLYQDSSTTSSASSSGKNKQATPFLIIPGHHGGILSQLYCDKTGRFMVSASGNRGWGHSTYTDTVLVYEIDFEG